MSLDSSDLKALLALMRAQTTAELEREHAKLRSLLGWHADVLEPHVEALRVRLIELQQARRLAATDALTGIANRRAFYDALRRELARATRSSTPLTVVMFDIDDFKVVNDTWGHAVGDKVLRLFARCATSVTRHGDLVGRIGGDEIVLLLPETERDQARAIAARVRADARTRAASQLPTTFGVSVGIASSGSGESAHSVMAAADRAMYRDKSARRVGRGRSDVARA